ncbi:MAG: T9SS type A sorting domain-containing protein, partial [Cytophagaceae bacterium]
VAGNVISWPAASTLNVGDSLVYKFWVTVKDATYFNCASGGPTPSTFTNKAAAKADREQPAYASVTTAASCTPVVVISPSMSKTADKASYISGEVITYTINYKNTSGTKIQGNTVASDWSIVAGTTPMSAMFNAATQEINLAAGYTGLGKGWTYTYSHGTNGFIKGTFDLQRFNSTYCIIMRHNGSTWVEARFFVNFGSIDISIYNMPANTLIGSALSVPFANSKPPVFDFQLQLNNADILIWAGDPGVTFGAIPAGTVTGLPVQAGYAGVRGLADPSTAAKLRNWYTYLDSQFNLQMTDPIPAQLTYNSASNATYQAVNYTGSNVAGTVTWQIIPGPVLYNDQISFVWKGTISNCSPSITNTAFAKLRGISPDPAGAVTVSCNGGTTPVTLLDFSGRFVEATVVLQWQTSNEINNAYFILEKSVNGIDFTPLAVVPATSGNSALNSYEYKDQPAAAGLNYYRLKQVDLDGTASSGKIISVRAAGEEKIIVYPNPFMDETEIEVLTSGRERISYSVKTMLGNLVAESQVAYTNEKIRLGSGLADGVYILELNTGNGLKIFKLVKTK